MILLNKSSKYSPIIPKKNKINDMKKEIVIINGAIPVENSF